MQVFVPTPSVLHDFQQRAILEELAALDGRVDARDVLVDHAPSAKAHVSHLTVAHDPLRQAHFPPTGMQQPVGILTQQLLKERRRGGDRVELRIIALPPTIEDNQQERRTFHA